MATFCYRCPSCAARYELSEHIASGGQCGPCWVERDEEVLLVRDYRAENVGVNVQQLKDERNAGGRAGYDNLFLPSNRDFAGPGDPDGTKGMRAWRDTHAPKDTNHKPRWPGTVEKQVM